MGYDLCTSRPRIADAKFRSVKHPIKAVTSSAPPIELVEDDYPRDARARWAHRRKSKIRETGKKQSTGNTDFSVNLYPYFWPFDDHRIEEICELVVISVHPRSFMIKTRQKYHHRKNIKQSKCGAAIFGNNRSFAK